MTKISLFYALLLSRERQAALQILFPLFGYQLLVDRVGIEGYRLRIAYSIEEPHIDEHFPSQEALVAFLDDWDIPYDGWYPVDAPDDEDVSS